MIQIAFFALFAVVGLAVVAAVAYGVVHDARRSRKEGAREGNAASSAAPDSGDQPDTADRAFVKGAVVPSFLDSRADARITPATLAVGGLGMAFLAVGAAGIAYRLGLPLPTARLAIKGVAVAFAGGFIVYGCATLYRLFSRRNLYVELEGEVVDLRKDRMARSGGGKPIPVYFPVYRFAGRGETHTRDSKVGTSWRKKMYRGMRIAVLFRPDTGESELKLDRTFHIKFSLAMLLAGLTFLTISLVAF